jgi:hypothetical protein
MQNKSRWMPIGGAGPSPAAEGQSAGGGGGAPPPGGGGGGGGGAAPHPTAGTWVGGGGGTPPKAQKSIKDGIFVFINRVTSRKQQEGRSQVRYAQPSGSPRQS